MRQHVCLWAILAMLCATSGALAQDLDDLDEGVVVEEPFEPGVEANTWELGFSVGFLDLKKTLLEVDRVILDVENPTDAIFGDMIIEGEQGFSPQLHVNRTLGKHFAFENVARFSISDFLQSTTSEQQKWTNTESVNTLTEEEVEKGSVFVFAHEHSLTYYPLSDGRVLPFLSAGVGTQTIEMDSDYTGGATNALQFGGGVGLRIVGDDLYSFRVEARWYRTQFRFKVDDHFREVISLQGDSIVRFPVGQLVDVSEMDPAEIEAIRQALALPDDQPVPDQLPRSIEEFEERTFTNFFFSVGFVAAF